MRHRSDLKLWSAAIAGHYVPNLALAVVKFNEAADASDRINIKGFMAGRTFSLLAPTPCLPPEMAHSAWHFVPAVRGALVRAFACTAADSSPGPAFQAKPAVDLLLVSQEGGTCRTAPALSASLHSLS